MPTAQALGEIIAMLTRPFPLERQMAHKNASVFGGLDKYVARWALEARGQTDHAAEIAALDQVRALFADYDVLPPNLREERLRKAEALLAHFSRRAPEQPPVAAPTPAPRRPRVTRPANLPKGYPLIGDPITKVKGIGPRFGALLEKLGVRTIEEFLWQLPRRHEDRRNLCAIKALRHGETATVWGKVTGVSMFKPKPGLTITRVTINDGSGTLTMVWFNNQYIRSSFVLGMRVVACGKAERKFNAWQIASPEFEKLEADDDAPTGGIVPVYGLTEKLSQQTMRRLARIVLERHAWQVRELLPESVLRAQGLMGRAEAILAQHLPETLEERDAGYERLVFEELFVMQVGLALRRRQTDSVPRGLRYELEDTVVDEFAATLPFPLTGAQRRTLFDVVADVRRPVPMSRLTQGDVGSGKTVVAAFCAWLACRSGFQAAIMAPTEILAEQLSVKMRELIGDRYSVRLLKSAMSGREKKATLKAVALGEVDVVVGTHALIQEGVHFRALSMAIVDEQHRFGVMQRGMLRSKGYNPDVLVMTATPIPRTLALTVYGDLDVSTIDELPPGRSPIRSEWCQASDLPRVHGFIREQVAQGRQVYVVCPLVEESEKLEASAATAEAERVSAIFPDLRVGLLHGRMKSDEKDDVMDRFRAGALDILVSTTVIEVGVDVPNATLMVIQDAERFGLAQLHQLRGRVGRGAHQSYCYFIADPASETGAKRMRTIASTTDGFKIAEADLKFRGPGEFYGARQSGLPDLQVADLVRDRLVLERARRAAWELITRDHALETLECLALRGEVSRAFRGQLGHLLS